MSITSRLLLFLLYIFISLHASNAGLLQNKYHSSFKNKEKMGLIQAETAEDMRSLLSNQQEETKREAAVKETIETQGVTKGKTMMTSTKTLRDQNTKFDHDDDHQNESQSLVSIPWRVPRQNRCQRERNPSFNLDYSPPKTHPPSHN